MWHGDLPRRKILCLGAHTGTPLGLLHFRATLSFLSARVKDSGFRVGQPGAWSERCLTLIMTMVVIVIPIIVKIAVIYHLPISYQF